MDQSLSNQYPFTLRVRANMHMHAHRPTMKPMLKNVLRKSITAVGSHVHYMQPSIILNFVEVEIHLIWGYIHLNDIDIHIFMDMMIILETVK